MKGSFSGTANYDIERGLITRNGSKGHVTIEMRPDRGNDKKDAKSGKKDADDDDDDEADAPAKPMKVNADVKQSMIVMAEADRAKQKADAAKKSEGKPKKESAVKKPAGKKDSKPAKKDDDDDD